jgi:predicted enzyme related to lactoylglutathione lyase
MNDPRYFESQADDPTRAAAFYRAIFGWEIVRDESIPIEYWRIDTRGGIEGAILERPVAAPPERSGTNAAVISMQVENFEVDPNAC